ncbi:bifunctional diaminohydroxyphosphoribosylaminopyrimidine deaminase/5-amino-6-(5-phosphoribosylamino)uracil reductase RibD [Spelaeicoccus albus]|uniref:Riboflavin biosynthesis protein RibD n=1 Tax=Spelaeicoccus albus TaxID=1280376 RepID=A0A7Z0D3N5_9MICO|nr:bifunctional diaminohydroxyphosphoribosylaminopyrimidine deaminase/5-amino-6-(5-phosphoribosylamino)uracil reductase RibD [Spelaeicoccus albus]NYI68295.1 diaminohydroxyphosphoribosylaminopyrimidine deaminase/5-amino-6-(5-phosphoribosylamino)uracil reductase [Spelaeicoccus albus]
MTPAGRTAIDAAMMQAVDESRRGAGLTAPNPRVGAVILDADGNVVGSGYHARAGSDHAEVVALRNAGDRARGGTAVVTLEPCRHQGRTPPCTQALLDAGIDSVAFAVADPIHSGGGDQLEAHGVAVRRGVRETEAREANHEWLIAEETKRIHVTYKAAATLDGRIAAADGTSQWISSEASRQDAQTLRRRADAVIAGIGTVLHDDPRLTRRGPDGRELPDQPLRVVIDSSGRTPPEANVRNGRAPTLIGTTDEFGADPAGRVDLDRLCADLYARGHRGALLEGGPTVAGEFLARGLIDRIVVYVAPTLLGTGRPLIGDIGVGTLRDASRWRLHDVAPIGDDVRLTYLPRTVSQEGIA